MNYIFDREKVNSKIYKLIPNEILEKIKRRDSILIEKNDSVVLSPKK